MAMAWTIIIEGNGPHHTAPAPGDANQDMANFIDTLRSHGQSISSSVFRYGGAHSFSDENVVDTAGYRAQLAAEAGTTPMAPVATAAQSPGSTSEAIAVDGGLVGETT